MKTSKFLIAYLQKPFSQHLVENKIKAIDIFPLKKSWTGSYRNYKNKMFYFVLK